ncbi:hypothetical protein CSE16_19315 [Solibacillus sp. R5-41]|uniref:DUF4181 domain-containing protein n=1 Tax=Solibacillus sp. R5-41 TaxID=2048654 RepID=UPI000C127807|nr:hypothetical protein CSE16_19315 [Solibacillus sp. R5-41]
MYEFFPGSLLILLLVLFLVFWIFGIVIRKLLGVEKRKSFSYNHVNDRHKKLDWSVRIIFLILLLFSNYYTIYNKVIGTYWYIEPWFVLIIFILISELLRAFMEWKYAENKRDFIATIAELLFIITFLFLLIITDFLGLL